MTRLLKTPVQWRSFEFIEVSMAIKLEEKAHQSKQRPDFQSVREWLLKVKVITKG